MAKLLSPAGFWIRAGLGLAVTASLLWLPRAVDAQHVFPRAVFASKKKDAPPPPPPVRATVQPSFTIAAEPLGFSSPGTFYLGMRNSLVSLDFLGEDRLLFTFRVPGLIHRAANSDRSETERNIRAIVLHLPDGAVEAEALWTLHDRARYIYPLGSGKFLLRDQNTLQLGDDSLQLNPYLQFPGPVLWVELDPSGRYVVTQSSEPPNRASRPGEVSSPDAAQAHLASDDQESGQQSDVILRILRREGAKVMLVSHVNSPVHLAINADGFLELLRANGTAWTLNFHHFTGGSTVIGSVDSACSPMLNFLSAEEFLTTACTSNGDPKLVAMGMNGRRLWENPSIGPSVWPVLVTNANGTRMARESLLTSHDVNAREPLDVDDIKGQDVQILDAATGKLVLRAAASPIFDAGGNVAISPSGRRVAILMEGNLQIFDLPAPPPVPDVSLTRAGK